MSEPPPRPISVRSPSHWRPPAMMTALAALAVAVLILEPPSAYGWRMLTLAGIQALAVLGFQVVFGWGGLLSLAHGTFFGVGAYTAALTTGAGGLPPPLDLAAAALVPAMLALVVTWPVRRLESHYFSLATLGVAQVVLLGALHAQSLTGGANGLAGIPPLALGPWTVPRGWPLAAVVWSLAGAGGVLAWTLQRGRFGQALAVLRDHPPLAASLGLAPHRLRLGALVLSAAYAGVAGGLLVHTQRVVSPEVLEFPVLVAVLSMAMVGGRDRVAGAFLGALLLVHLPEWLRGLEQAHQLGYGLALLATILLVPDGLAGLAARLFRRLGLTTPPPHPIARPPGHPSAPRPAPSAPRPGPPPDTAPLLEIRDLAVSFGGVRAVAGVSFVLQPGELVGVIGANGSGKTTLLNLLSGMIPGGHGSARLDGAELLALPADAIARRGVARSFQSGGLPPGATVLEAVTAARLDRESRHEAAAHALWFLQQDGLAALAHRPALSLPPGQRRGVELVRALARQPRLLLLDEPAAGLDASERHTLSRRLAQLAETGLALLVVEHDLDLLARCAGRLLCLAQGQLVYDGPAASARTHPQVITACLGTACLGTEGR